MSHNRNPRSKWNQKKRNRFSYCNCVKCRLRREIWRTGHKDPENAEIVNIFKPFFFHPQILIDVGDVLAQGRRYIHPAFITPVEQTIDPFSREYWREFMLDMPKMKM